MARRGSCTIPLAAELGVAEDSGVGLTDGKSSANLGTNSGALVMELVRKSAGTGVRRGYDCSGVPAAVLALWGAAEK